MPRSKLIEGDNLTLDMVLVRAYGFPGQALIREAMKLNPGLSAHGTFLPPGKTILIPDKPAADDFKEIPVISLFG